MDSLDCLIFDVDGTIAETEEQHRLAFNDVFAANRLDWVWDQDLYRRLLQVTGGRERLRLWVETVGAAPGDFPDERIEALHHAKNARLGERISAGLCLLRPGVARLIGEARAAGLRLAVATTTSRVNIQALIRATFGREAEAVFDTLVTGEDVTAKKPHPEAYLTVLERLRLDPTRCLVLEDTHIGLTAATGAGLATVVTPSFYSAGEDFAAATAVLPDLGDVGLADLARIAAAARA